MGERAQGQGHRRDRLADIGARTARRRCPARVFGGNRHAEFHGRAHGDCQRAAQRDGGPQGHERARTLQPSRSADEPVGRFPAQTGRDRLMQQVPAALAGIRVLDLTTNYAAYAGRLLADLGADVVRLEPSKGSPVRGLAPCQPGPAGEPLSFAHAFLDAGKRSVTLDLATTTGRELLAELATTSDAMIETPSPTAGNGVDFELVRQRNPGLVVVSISAFGRDGPYAGYAATDLTLLAAGGLLSLGGYADSEPLAVQCEQAMLASGSYGAVSARTALRELTQTGSRCCFVG